jgi:hypothetical protein
MWRGVVLGFVLGLAVVAGSGCGGEPEPVTHTGNRFDKLGKVRGLEPTNKNIKPGATFRGKR